MTSPGARRVTETLPDPQAEDLVRSEPRAFEAEEIPDAATIAEESAAIYPDTNPGPPTPEEIATEAYRIYMVRGARDGHDLDDWLEAERRISQARRANA
jgi:hypothetical protein